MCKAISTTLLLSLSIIICGCGNFAVNHTRQPAKMPAPDHRISFRVINKDEYRSYIPLKDYREDDLRKKIHQMSELLIKYRPDHKSRFAKHYRSYDQILSYEARAKMMIGLVKHKILGFEEKGSHHNTEDGVESLETLNRDFECNALFKQDWPLDPEVLFSAEFYKIVIPRTSEVMLSYGTNALGEPVELLPAFSRVMQDGHEEISEHYIDKKFGLRFLTQIKFPDKDKSLYGEASFFKELLQLVVKDKIILLVTVHDHQSF